VRGRISLRHNPESDHGSLGVMNPTPVFDTYWRFATERQSIFYRRLTDPVGPWTSDPVLRQFRFTNAYRATDRISQYLIREVQYRSDRSRTPQDLFFRTMLFKIFNRIDTWETIERALGPIKCEALDLHAVSRVLDGLLKQGRRVYSAAYIMPSPPFGHQRKHTNHLALLSRMMADQLPERIHQAPSLRSVYELLLQYPGIGPFLALQYTIDLNYSELLSFDESSFVVAGPGALDGIAKCFTDVGEMTAEEIIYWMTDHQDAEFSNRRLGFERLFGRPLQPIDCQNLFCEISKYARVAHADVQGISDRRRIKQTYHPHSEPLPTPTFPPRWHLTVPEALVLKAPARKPVQGTLF